MTRIKGWFDDKLRRLVGRLLSIEGEDGHNRLCRFISWVCHYGPHGTFAHQGHLRMESGGYICLTGTRCGEPTESYMRQMHEQLEWFHRTEGILRKSGALVSMVWENPRFSAAGLCNCGQSDNRKFPDHVPLCPYRVEHDFPVSVEEYREAIAPLN